jgi:hypothetical protein
VRVCRCTAAGFFKGKRELLSPALLNRFNPVVFKPLPRQEWEQIVAHLLQQGGLPDQQTKELSKLLVGCHMAVQAAITGADGGSAAFPEVRAICAFENDTLPRCNQFLAL